ncbi:MAG: phosphatase PAP2 family protein [Methanococcaceae archaeon]
MRRTLHYKIIILLLFLIQGNIIVIAQQFPSDNNRSLLFRANQYSFRINSAVAPDFSQLNNYNTLSLASTTSSSIAPDIKIYSGLGNNIVNSFKGDNLYLHLAGITSTVLLVASSSDYHVHKFFNEHEQYGMAARPVIRVATYFPFVIGGSLYAYGKLNKDHQAVGASFAVLQSTVLAFTYNSLLKALTGRPNPNWRENNDMEGLSKTFRFGFWRGGIFWGWPSGHTSSTMAVVSALTNFYPDKTWLKIAGYSYTAYMIFAVSSLNRGSMHWFSDAVAAAFMSYAIGSTVGKFYRSKFAHEETTGIMPAEPVQTMPIMNFIIPL